MERKFSYFLVLLLIQCSFSSKILFIRGGLGTGGLGPDGDNTQLSDIDDCESAAGFGDLGLLLRANNVTVDQITEGNSPNLGPADLSDLATYNLVVMGSNNDRSYSTTDIDALEDYVSNGGNVIFISDGNWGRRFGEAPSSDQLFLNRFGLTMNQDSANGEIRFERANGDYLIANHPFLNGVNSFFGEGVSFITVDNPAIINAQIVVRAKTVVRLNTGVDAGPTRPVDSTDASLVVGTFGNGSVVAFVDRNNFFNGLLYTLDGFPLVNNMFGILTQNAPFTATNFTKCPPIASTSSTVTPVTTGIFSSCSRLLHPLCVLLLYNCLTLLL